VRGVERVRLGTSYGDVVQRVGEVLRLIGPRAESTAVVVDATGVGTPVVELMRAARFGCRIVAVTITAGQRETSDGSGYHVPKQDLMTGLRIGFEQRKVDVAAGSPGSAALARELLDMRVRGEKFGAAPGKHDDLVFAVALGWWWMRKLGFKP
jgi:hypothetical protein